MKRLLRLLPLLLIAALALSCLCFADEEESPYRLDIYRLNDFTDHLSENQRDALDEVILDQMNTLHLDLPVILKDDYGDETMREYGERIYPQNELGYGESKDGLLLLVDTVNLRAEVLAFGESCQLLYTSADRARMAEDFLASYLQNDFEDAIGTYLDDVNTYLAEDDEETGQTEPVAEADPLPDWYPEDVSGFRDFHTSENTPRVVDLADIFTDSEEVALSEKLNAMRQRLGADFVIFTDTVTHGYSKSVYSADFYTFNGYGVGDDYNGMILFICMEPGNRGWWETGTGACEKLFTRKNVNALDDILEPYMHEGRYAEGVTQFFTAADTLFTSGRFPLSSGAKLLRVLIACVISLIITLFFRGILRGKMKVVRQGAEADEYLVKDSFKLRNSQNFFLRCVTSRVRIERNTSSGGSSYSGGYHSSSGRSFSGGGRSF